MLRAKPSRAVRHGGKGGIDVGSVRAVRGAGGRAGCAWAETVWSVGLSDVPSLFPVSPPVA